MISIWSLNKALKAYDRNLYARESKDGIVRVYQRIRQTRTHWLSNEISIDEYVDGDWLVCSLTENWGSSGKQRDWGILPVIEHIKQGSLEYRDNLSRELNREQQRVAESKVRDTKNIAEDAAYAMRDDMKNAFSDVLTHSMDMKNDVRRKTEKRGVL